MPPFSAMPFQADRASDSLEVRLLGVVEYESALRLQEQLVAQISGRADRQGGLLVCEHPPVITVGREGSTAHILAGPEEIRSRLLEIRWVNRGGGCLLHLPGQLAVYPVVPLDRLRLGLAGYRRCLEQAVIDVCREQNIPAERRENEPGVFCRLGQLAFLGVAVRSWVAYHGLFLNVNPMLKTMQLVQSGRQPRRVTSMSAQRQRVVSMHAVREGMIRRLAARLGYETLHLYTGHPLLRRTKKEVHVFA